MSTFIHENRTPNGNPFRLECRVGTNDQNVSHSVSKLDEYGLRGLELEGWAIDVGAYIGAVAIPLAIDHPELAVVAVEPIPENVAILQRNIVLNDVADQVLVCPLAAVGPGRDLAAIRYGGDGLHRFVGNADECLDGDVFDAPGISLGDLLIFYRIDGVALMKIDCEGCEWSFLNTEATMCVKRIVGEWHGDVPTDFLPMHEVAIDRNWHFWAERL